MRRRFAIIGVLVCAVPLIGAGLHADPWSQNPSAQDTLEALREKVLDCPAEDLAGVQQEAFARYVHEMDAFHALSAARLAEAMHDRAQATWSAISLAGALRRGGEASAAVVVLSEQVDRTRAVGETVALWEALAMAFDALGRDSDRRATLGRAYARGGRDAQQILGGLALGAGHWQEAQRLFGSLVDSARVKGQEPDPWALPGWGLSLAEAGAPTPPGPENGSSASKSAADE